MLIKPHSISSLNTYSSYSFPSCICFAHYLPITPQQPPPFSVSFHTTLHCRHHLHHFLPASVCACVRACGSLILLDRRINTGPVLQEKAIICTLCLQPSVMHREAQIPANQRCPFYLQLWHEYLCFLWCNCRAECLRATEFIRYEIKHKEQPHPTTLWLVIDKTKWNAEKNGKKPPVISMLCNLKERWLYNAPGCVCVSIQDRTGSFLHLMWLSLSLWPSGHNTHSHTPLMSSRSIHIWQTVIHLCMI